MKQTDAVDRNRKVQHRPLESGRRVVQATVKTSIHVKVPNLECVISTGKNTTCISKKGLAVIQSFKISFKQICVCMMSSISAWAHA